MARSLVVWFYDQICGTLVQNDTGDLEFTYAPEWLQSSVARPLSNSLPLRKESYSSKECQGFFGGILPEQASREKIAKNLGISSKNDFGLLEHIGGECAGAVSFARAGENLQFQEDGKRSLDLDLFARILREIPLRPLMAGEEGVRLSLAGAQPKLAVRMEGEKAFLPLGSTPSTHIIKPALREYKGIVQNEAYCMMLAAKIQLNAAHVDIRFVEELECLLIERYDRLPVTQMRRFTGKVERLHQEDFCQALGIISERKYQNEGGPALSDCFQLVREISSRPVIDLRALLDAAIFNYLIGNCDAHGKNFSLLYSPLQLKPTARLAPLYDLICTRVYPELSSKMAMKIGGEYEHAKVLPRHFEMLAEEAGLSPPRTLERVANMSRSILSALEILEVPQECPEVPALIRAQCERMLRLLDLKRASGRSDGN